MRISELTLAGSSGTVHSLIRRPILSYRAPPVVRNGAHLQIQDADFQTTKSKIDKESRFNYAGLLAKLCCVIV